MFGSCGPPSTVLDRRNTAAFGRAGEFGLQRSPLPAIRAHATSFLAANGQVLGEFRESSGKTSRIQMAVDRQFAFGQDRFDPRALPRHDHPRLPVWVLVVPFATDRCAMKNR